MFFFLFLFNRILEYIRPYAVCLCIVHVRIHTGSG